MGVTHVFAGIPVTDYDGARRWYERLLGRPPDGLPREGEAVWQLTDTSLIYVVDDRNRAGAGLVTVAVDRLDDQLSELVGRGIPTQTETLANGLQKATVRDPDGNTINFFEPPSSDAGSA